MIAKPSPARRLLRLNASNKLALAEGLLFLAAASAAIAILPFRRTVGLMHDRLGKDRPDEEAQRRLAAQCRWAVLAWAERVPWRAVCFQRGLALHLMLRRRGVPSVLHYGVAQSNEAGLQAHVWIDVGERTVLGGEEAPKFARVTSFPAARQE